MIIIIIIGSLRHPDLLAVVLLPVYLPLHDEEGAQAEQLHGDLGAAARSLDFMFTLNIYIYIYIYIFF